MSLHSSFHSLLRRWKLTPAPRGLPQYPPCLRCSLSPSLNSTPNPWLRPTLSNMPFHFCRLPFCCFSPQPYYRRPVKGAGDKDGAHPDGGAPPMRPPASGSYAGPLALGRCSANAHGVSLEHRLLLTPGVWNLLREAGQAPLGSAPSHLLPVTTSACQSGSFRSL